MSSLTALNLSNMVEKEINDCANSSGKIQAVDVVSSFRNVALDFEMTIAQLPTNLWQIFTEFNNHMPDALFTASQVNRRIHMACPR